MSESNIHLGITGLNEKNTFKWRLVLLVWNIRLIVQGGLLKGKGPLTVAGVRKRRKVEVKND